MKASRWLVVLVLLIEKERGGQGNEKRVELPLRLIGDGQKSARRNIDQGHLGKWQLRYLEAQAAVERCHA